MMKKEAVKKIINNDIEMTKCEMRELSKKLTIFYERSIDALEEGDVDSFLDEVDTLGRKCEEIKDLGNCLSSLRRQLMVVDCVEA